MGVVGTLPGGAGIPMYRGTDMYGAQGWGETRSNYLNFIMQPLSMWYVYYSSIINHHVTGVSHVSRLF
jgi:hypothetical protein